MEKIEHSKVLFDDVGPLTPLSLERLRLMELDCENRKDPNSFYLTFTISNPPLISWSHNIDRQLGITDLNYETFFDCIHPVWLPLHLGFGTAAYGIRRKVFQKWPNELAVYTTNIPMRHEDGTYHWYNQVSFPIGYDNKGRMVSHINQYHRLCVFNKLVPSRPKMTINGNWISEYDEDFNPVSTAALSVCLTRILTPANYRILETYRALTKSRNGKWVSPAKKMVREELGLSADAINKANVRIIQSIKGKFPDSVTRDVASFSIFLNDLCC